MSPLLHALRVLLENFNARSGRVFPDLLLLEGHIDARDRHLEL